MKQVSRIVAGLMIFAFLTSCTMKEGSLSIDNSKLNKGVAKEAGATSETEDFAGADLIIYSYTDDFESEIAAFEKANNCKVSLKLVDKADFAPMVSGMIEAKMNAPDLIVTDIKNLYDPLLIDKLAELDDLDAKYDWANNIAPYMYKTGKLSNQKLKAIGYTISPVVGFYRRSLAKQVFGTDDPEQIAKLFDSYDAILGAATKLSQQKIKMFPDLYGLRHLANLEETTANYWFNQAGRFQLTETRMKYLQFIKTMELDQRVAAFDEWSDQWLDKMKQPTTAQDSVFAYLLPSFGLNEVIMLVGDTDQPVAESETGQRLVFNQTSGDWGIVPIANADYIGSSYIGLNKDSDKKELAEKFIVYMTGDEAHLKEWVAKTGILSANVNVITQSSDLFANQFVGGQDAIKTYIASAGDVSVGDKTVPTGTGEANLKNPYYSLNQLFQRMTVKFIRREYHTANEAIDDFSNMVKKELPELFPAEPAGGQ